MIFPEPVISIAIEPKTKADVEKLGVGAAEARRRRPVVPHPHRRGDRADDHQRHGRAPPRDHRRPPEARVQGRVERRQARGRLPRGDHARRSPASTSTPSRPAAAASTATCSWRSSRPSAARASSSRTTSSAASIPKEFIPAIEKGVREAMARGVLAGYPLVDMQVPPLRRQLPRRRLERAGVRDRRRRSASRRRREARGLAPARADHEERGRRPRAVHGRRHRRPQLAPRPHPRDEPARQRAGHRRRGAAGHDVRLRDRPAVDDAGPRDVARIQFSHYAPVPAAVQEEIVAKVKGLSDYVEHVEQTQPTRRKERHVMAKEKFDATSRT